jgi:hypothetical protein
VAVLAGLLAVAVAGPALAHGAGPREASNYASRVERIVDDAGAPVAPPGLDVRVSPEGALTLTNRTGRPLVVQGLAGEPYLRVEPDGVFVNAASPTAYPGAGADADLRPRWERIGDGPAWSWHDDRVHWQAATAPPAVKVDPSRRVDVLAWSVPLELDGDSLTVHGTVTWVPAPPWPPWLLAGVALLGVPLVPALRARALLPAAAAGLAVAAVLTLARGLDLALLPGGQPSAGLVQAGAACTALAAALAARRGRAPAAAVAAGGALLLIATATGALQVLGASQVPARLPDALVRLSAALDLAVVLPVAAAVAAHRGSYARAVTGEPVETVAPVPWR